MDNNKNSLIAFNDLEKLIIKPGFCTLCGACEAACPVHALQVKDDKLERTHDCSKYMDFCPICYNVCPHSEALLLESMRFLADAPNKRESLGYYRKVILARATVPILRKASRGGGVIASILTNAIQKGIIDSAVVSRQEKTVAQGLKPSVLLVPDDIFAAVDAEFFPSAVARAFGNAVQEYGKTKIAFVGTPCQVLALRKLESWEHKIVNSLSVVIGMMCLWSFSLPTLLKDVEENKGINLKDIEKITLNGYYSLHLKDRIETMPIDDARKHIMQGCSTCSDYSSLLADISVGNAYPLEEWSLVIVRTKIGEEFFNRALNEGCIEAKELENETAVFSHITTMDNLKKKIALGEIERIRSNDRPTPPNLGLLRPDDIESPSKEITMLDKLTVTEIMTSGVMTISPETTATELFGIMTKHHHMGYPIVDDDGNLTGIATFEDIMKIPLEERSKVKVGSIVHERLFTVAPTDTALAAYRMMMAHGIGRILVVDQLNPHKLLGIITRTDILHVFTWFPRQK